jgi:hypothetical protein
MAQQSTDVPKPSSPSHGVCALAADESLVGGSSGSGHAPSGLLASTYSSLPRVVMEYNLDDDFCWAGDKDGFNYGVAPKDESPITGYVPSGHMPSLNHSQVIPTSSLPLASSAVGQWASSSPTTCISLPETLLYAI